MAIWRRPARTFLYKSLEPVAPWFARETMRRREADRLDWLAKGQSRVIFLACMPKSGSSFLREALLNITGFPRGYARQEYDGRIFFEHNEHDVFEEKVVSLYKTGVVIQQHTKGTLHNYRVMNKYGVKPLILYRNIFDIVVSLKDHYERESQHLPVGYIPEQYFELDDEGKYLFIIKNNLPWYFDFLSSWLEASRHISMLEINYEEMVADRLATLSKILAFYQMNYSHTQIEDALSQVDQKKSRKNVGRAGRGQSLSAANRREIIELARVWRLSDERLARIGITTELLHSTTSSEVSG